MRKPILAAALLALTLPIAAQTAPKDAPKPTESARRARQSRSPSRVAISPDGTTIAWTLREREGSTLHITTLADPDPAKEKLVTASTETACSNGNPIWSPDSQWLAFTSSCTSKVEKPGQEQIFLWSRKDGAVKQLTHVTGNIAQPAWSPDGRTIAFLFVENATRSAGALDAMKPWAGVIGEDGVEIQHVAMVTVPGAATPTERRIVGVKLSDGNAKSSTPRFDTIARNPNSSMPSCPAAEATSGTTVHNETHGAEGRVMPIPTCLPANSMTVRSTSQPVRMDPDERLARLNAISQPAETTAQQITPDELHVYEFSWSPDSKEIAFIAAAPPGENTWWIAQLYLQHAKIGSSPHSILDPQTVPGALHGLQIAVPRYSPDGKRISFIGGLMSDQGSTGGDVWVINADGKTPPVDVTPGIDGTPTYAIWTRNTTIGFVEDRRGHNHLVDWDADKHALVPEGDLDMGAVSLGGGAIKNAVAYSPANGDTLAYVKSGPAQPAEIFVLDSKTGEHQITHLNDGLKSTAHIESVEWENEGFHVQGWLTYPTNYDASKKYPMIVTVHGGPSSSAFPRGGGQWADLGYFEFQPNPRGSFGQGEAFTAANRKDFGYGDLRDVLTGVDAIEKKLPIDDHRLGLTGWSYGGFMSMFAETQTTRFAAIVAGAGLSNWQSYYGENSIDQWMIPFFGASVYDDPAVYAKSSAINYIKNSETPMLIIVGDRDGECPAPQSFEMWHALKAVGVKTQLVVYPNEGHGFRDPAHIADRQERTIKWFAENMPAKK